MRRFINNGLITHSRKGRLSGQEGMTLLEVMIALVILAIGLLAVSGMQIMSIRANSSGFKFTTAAALADQRIVQIANLSFSDPALNAGNVVEPAVTVQNVVYNRSYTIVDGNPITGVKRITYTVTWDNGAHTISLMERVGNELL
ncbi:MAG: prepilin-type N-terminal cleavage/methylation domain-containing protein [Nitrospirae bacterium]|nr:prepilin-type N-terminal cleavage/methylation domain-containing protein [Nitrospirota bacterium]